MKTMENKAIVIKIIAGAYTLYDKEKNEKILAKPRGNFRYNNENIKVGDLVSYSVSLDNVSIEKRLPRKNELVRPSIANIDQAIVVFSVKEPDLNLNLLDKFLAVMEYNNIKTVIVFNKMDLINDDNSLNEIFSYYEKIGYEVVYTSTKNNDIECVKTLLKDKISVITGQSGVGKSSILNQISPDLQLETNAISKALGRGKHTTRYTELIPLCDGWIADTPGFGTMNIEDLDEQSLAHSFVEFFEASSSCKYKGCKHINEPGCNVRTLVDSGEILKSRYENYCLFNKSIKEKKRY